MVSCKCVFLDGKEVEVTVEKEAKGSDLFDSICKYLGLKYRDPFGVVFRGGVGPAPYNWWIRMNKTLKGQIPGKCKVWEFAFMVKYYPRTLAGMNEEVARYHVIMQIRQDLLTGRLKCPVQTMSHLCSYWLQAQYGDWASRHIDLQLADAFRYVQTGVNDPNPQAKSDIAFEEQMMQIHQTHRGMTTREADFRFIKLASSLPDYGIHYYPAYLVTSQQAPPSAGRRLLSLSSQKDANGEKSERLTIGIGPLGIHQYRKKGNNIVYTWKAMRAVSFKRNRIVLRMQGAIRQNMSAEESKEKDATKNQKMIVKEYYLEDMYQTKIIWEALIEYHMFFRVGDQQGLKSEERKRMISSLKFKRTIPMVGEKMAGPSPMSPSSKTSSRSPTHFKFDTPATQSTSPKRSSSVPPRRSNGTRPSSPKPVPHKLAKMNGRGRSASLPHSGEEPDTDLEGEKLLSPGPLSSQRPMERGRDPRRNVATPASTSTPMSGTFLFPPKSALRIPTTSLASNSGEDILDGVSLGSDNTEVLCSPGLLEKTFSYSEEDGVNKIGYWNEALTPRSRTATPRGLASVPILRGRSPRSTEPSGEHRTGTPRGLASVPILRETQRGRSPRSAEPIEEREAIESGASNTASPRQPSDTPIVIPAEILMQDLRESRRIRAQGGYVSSSSSDFPMELDYVPKNPPRRLDYVSSRVAELAPQGIPERAGPFPPEGRRAQSMHSLRTSARERSPRGRSTSPKRGRHTSPLRRREPPTSLPPQPASARLPEKRGYSDRAYSESKLAHKDDVNRSIHGAAMKSSDPVLSSVPTPKRRAPSTLPRRQNTSGRSGTTQPMM